MGKKCIVLGAGFSKAIANLPLTNEMIDSFQQEFEKRKKSDKNLYNINNNDALLFKFLNNIKNEYLDGHYKNISPDGKILTSNYFENFEGILSFIDLNLSFEVQFLSVKNGEQANGSSLSPFSKNLTYKFKEIRSIITKYLYSVLINAEDSSDLLSKFHSHFLTNCDTIITFNYDLLLEKYLFQNDMWFPKDGYGFTPAYLPNINGKYLNRVSEIKLLKLHGSLNWDRKADTNNICLNWQDDDGNYFFPGYLEKENYNDFKYFGSHSSGGWILPSWFKQFDYNELITVWRKSFEALNTSEEIIFIGYSLPSADSAVYALFSTIDWSGKKIIIYDPYADQLKDHFSKIMGKNIKYCKGKFEDFLMRSQHDC